MFNKNNPSLEIKDILNVVSEEDILAYYFNIYEIPCLINSPIRKDNKPSFSVYYSRSGKIRCYDFATGDCYGVFDLVKKKFGLSTFQNVLYFIYKDLNMFNEKEIIKQKVIRIAIKKNTKDFDVKIRAWREYDIEYWKIYGISQKMLKFANVFPISQIILKKIENTIVIPADKYAYVFLEKRGNVITKKVYQPFNEYDYRFFGTHNSSTWSLYEKLPERGDKIILTSSLKDAMCLWENLNIPSTSSQSESMTLDPEIIKDLDKRFKKKYILYDNDATGLKFSKLFAKEYGFENIIIPKEFINSKDPSDLYKNYGKKVFIDFFKQQIK